MRWSGFSKERLAGELPRAFADRQTHRVTNTDSTMTQHQASTVHLPRYWAYLGMGLVAALAALMAQSLPASMVLVGILLAIPITLFIIRKPVTSTIILLVLFPFHTLLIKAVEVNAGLSEPALEALSMWKEYVLIVLVIRSMTVGSLRSVTPLDLAILVYLGFSFIYIFVSDSFAMGAYGFRSVLEPFLFYLVARTLPIQHRELARLLKWLFIGAMLISVFGLVQAHVLGEPFLWKYKVLNGRLQSSHTASIGGQLVIRASSTFSSPNTLGMYLSILLLIGVGLLSFSRIGLLSTLFVASVLLGGLLITLSRSSWLAFAMGFMALFALRYKIRNTIVLGVSALTIIMVPALIILQIPQRILETLSLEDPSAAGKLPSILNGVKFVTEHPFGIGLGMTGPRSMRFLEEVQVHSENYYVLMAMEVGVIGLILYLLLLAIALFQLNESLFRTQDRLFKGVALGSMMALIGASIGVMFIPSLQELAVATLLWFFVGVGVRGGLAPHRENSAAQSGSRH